MAQNIRLNGSPMMACAQRAVREMPDGQTLTDPVVIYFRGGEYDYSNTQIVLLAADSGTPQSPTIYKAFEDETVRIFGGKSVDVTKVQKVTYTAVLDRLLDPFAKTKLVKLDLAEQGVTDVPDLMDYGFSIAGSWQPTEVYFNGTALTEAHWPNEEFVKTTSAVIKGSNSKTDSFMLGYEDADDHIQLTREEMAVIMVKAYAFLEKSAGRGGIGKFTDRETIANWAYAYVDEAMSAGLISGMTEETFAPLENTTRAQATSVMKRLLDQ